jgi:hypothetical protein
MGHRSSALPAPPAAATAPPPTAACGSSVRRWWVSGALLVLCALGCTQDLRLEVPRSDTRSALISPPAARGAEQPELLKAEVELFGLPLGGLESAICPHADGVTMSTHVEPAALVSALHRSGGSARTELSPVGPSLSEYFIQDGSLLRHYRIDHRPGSFGYLYDNGGAAHRTGHEGVPEGAQPHDLHSALALLRGWRPRLDEVGYFYVVLGRRLWRVEVRHVGPEMIRAQGAPQLSQRLDGVSVRLWQPDEVEPRRFSLWLSSDAARVPLRMVADASFGQVTLALTGREPAGERCGASAAAAAAR